MGRRFQFRSVRTQLIVYILTAALLPLLCTTAIISYQRVAAIKEQALVKLEAIRDLKLEALDSWFDERLADLRIITKDHEIRTFSASVSTSTVAERKAPSLPPTQRVYAT